jgi:hypothetical protein
MAACLHSCHAGNQDTFFGLNGKKKNRGKKCTQGRPHYMLHTTDLETSPAAEDEPRQRGDVEVIAPFLVQNFREWSDIVYQAYVKK